MVLRTDYGDGEAFFNTDANRIGTEVNAKGRRSATLIAPGATPTINTDDLDLVFLDGLDTPILDLSVNLIGSPVVGQKLMLKFRDNGTSQAITYGILFGSSGAAHLLNATVAGKVHHLGVMWDGDVWRALAVDVNGY